LTCGLRNLSITLGILVAASRRYVPVRSSAANSAVPEPFLRPRHFARGLTLLALFFSSCARYANFTLPPVIGGDPNLTFRLVEQPAPVIPHEQFTDALNPSVALPFNLYSVFDGKAWHTALATTSDGRRWQPQGIVLSPDPHTWEGDYIAANGSLLRHTGRLWYWYQAGPRGGHRIGLARSTDAKSWRKEPVPVLDHGPVGAWDERVVADPYVFRLDPYFYLYYLGQDRAARQRLGVARSTDGLHWEKLRSNPILELGAPGTFDEAGLGEPAVWQSHAFYWMLYTGRDIHEYRRLGLARSSDGVHWTRLPAVFAGTSPWDSKVICDPTVVVEGDRILVWFGGGDVPSPDENLHGQIGFATLVK
jgi:predicted GH43/DUF377 family glycosyl hydrolase